MIKKVQRKKLATDVADALRTEIAKGRWVTVLPGYRKLQEYFGVGRHAAVEALSILTQEGILLEAEAGNPRRVSEKGIAAVIPEIAPIREIRVVSCQRREVWPPYLSEVLSNVARGLGSEWSVEDLMAYNFQSQAPSGELENLVAQNPSCLWIFLAPPLKVLNWIESSRLEAICLGGAAKNSNVKCLGVDSTKISLEILEILSKIGHKKISFLSLQDREEYREKHAKRLGDAFAKKGLEYSPAYNNPIISYFDPIETKRQIEALLRRTPPTAVVCPGYKSYLSLFSCCAERGLRIGHDIQVVSLGEVKASVWLSAQPAFIQISIKEYTSKLIQWALDPKSMKKETQFLSWKLVGEDTLKPPP